MSVAARKPRISKAAFAAVMRDLVPYVGQLGIRVQRLGFGTISLVMPASRQLLRPGGTIAGPAQMALADIAMYGLVMSRLGRVELAVTTSLSINFLRRPAPAAITAEGRLLKLGRRLAVGDIILRSRGQPEAVAHAVVTYSLPPAKGLAD
ncbi:MAG: PaaI family thioesterase [Proteobacteria bacterium]|nr:PaaI family thioesterase [Pseudomonadota bacterium]